MPFLAIEDGVSVGTVEGERALRIYIGNQTITLVETEEGARLFGLNCRDEGNDEVRLSATHLNVLGQFCARMFMNERPVHYLRQIREYTKFAINKLEDWNARAREDEEHPPYGDITAQLHEIAYALKQLAKGLVPLGDHNDFDI